MTATGTCTFKKVTHPSDSSTNDAMPHGSQTNVCPGRVVARSGPLAFCLWRHHGRRQRPGSGPANLKRERSSAQPLCAACACGGWALVVAAEIVWCEDLRFFLNAAASQATLSRHEFAPALRVRRTQVCSLNFVLGGSGLLRLSLEFGTEERPKTIGDQNDWWRHLVVVRAAQLRRRA